MAKQYNQVPVTRNIKNPPLTILPADGTAFKTLYTASADDAVVKALSASSTDTAAANVQLAYNNGSADFVLGTVNVPITAGTTGAIPSVDLLGGTLQPDLPYDQNGKRVLPLQGGFILKARVLVTLTAGKQIDITSVIEEY